MADDLMPKVDFKKDAAHLDKAHLGYVEKIERQNLERVNKLLKTRRRNIFTGCVLAGCVVGIYFYSIAAVKQETFLDEFDTPKTEPDVKK